MLAMIMSLRLNGMINYGNFGIKVNLGLKKLSLNNFIMHDQKVGQFTQCANTLILMLNVTVALGL